MEGTPGAQPLPCSPEACSCCEPSTAMTRCAPGWAVASVPSRLLAPAHALLPFQKVLPVPAERACWS